MTDKTFTDKEIVKALECCFVMSNCKGCPCRESAEPCCLGEIGVQAFSLINRQKAEIERLTVNKEKEERMNHAIRSRMGYDCEPYSLANKSFVDKIAEEMKKPTEEKPIYSPEDISKMTPKQIRENYSDIMESMKKWS